MLLVPSFLLSFVRLMTLALALLAGAAFAQDQKPLDLDQTRATLAAIDDTLKNPTLNEADLAEAYGPTMIRWGSPCRPPSSL